MDGTDNLGTRREKDTAPSPSSSARTGETRLILRDALAAAKAELAAETYHILKTRLRISHDEMRTLFSEWNKGELADSVIAATADALRLHDGYGEPLLDKVLDVPHGKEPCAAAVSMAMDLGLPAAIFAQVASASFLASMKDARVDASAVLGGPKTAATGERHSLIEEVHKALLAAMILAHAQAFLLLRRAAGREMTGAELAETARSWGGEEGSGAFLMQLSAQAFDRSPELECLILDVPIKSLLDHSISSLRRLAARCLEGGLPAPAFTSALTFYDSYRSTWLPASLVSALRDSFSGSGFERIDRPRGEIFHSEWR